MKKKELYKNTTPSYLKHDTERMKKMKKKELYEIYEKTAPPYLKHDIEQVKKYRNDPTCRVFDCLLDEVYGSVNSALYDGEITEEQATYLRDKYYWLKDISNEEEEEDEQ